MRQTPYNLTRSVKLPKWLNGTNQQYEHHGESTVFIFLVGKLQMEIFIDGVSKLAEVV